MPCVLVVVGEAGRGGGGGIGCSKATLNTENRIKDNAKQRVIYCDVLHFALLF
jgi:hypothetical protein